MRIAFNFNTWPNVELLPRIFVTFGKRWGVAFEFLIFGIALFSKQRVNEIVSRQAAQRFMSAFTEATEKIQACVHQQIAEALKERGVSEN